MDNNLKLKQDNIALRRLVDQYRQSSGLLNYVDDSNIRGGFRVVKTIQERDSIDCCHKKKGMIVNVLSDGKWYELTSDTCSTVTWVEVEFGTSIPPGTYIPFVGVDVANSERVTGPIVIANYDYNQSPTTYSDYQLNLGTTGFLVQEGILDNQYPAYKFELNNTSGLTYTKVNDSFGAKTTQTFNVGVSGIYLSTFRFADNTGIARSGSISIDQSGNYAMTSGQSDVNTFAQKFVELTFRANENAALFNFYHSAAGLSRTTTLSINGIKTDTLIDVTGSSEYNRSLVQKADGTINWENKILRRVPFYGHTTGSGSTINDTMGDLIELYAYSPEHIYFVNHTNVNLVYYLTVEAGPIPTSGAPFIQAPAGKSIRIVPKPGTSSSFITGATTFQLKRGATYLVCYQNTTSLRVIEI